MKRGTQALGAIVLAEEATILVRSVPLRVPACYYVGSLPFFLALLYFWVDMSHSAFAYGRCVGSALGVAVAFIWMKGWQAVYARGLLAQVQGEEPPRWTGGRLIRLVVCQTAIQAWGFVALPLALLALLPLPWAYAYFQNVTVLGDGETDLREVRQRAWAQAKIWPRQNLVAMWLLSPLLVMVAAVLILVLVPVASALGNEAVEISVNTYAVLFGLALIPLSPLGLMAAWNLWLLLVGIPGFLETVLGVETMFARTGDGLANTTGLAIVCALVYLAMDPFMKAAYVLRCYYGASVETGADLSAQLRTVISKSSALLGVLLFLLAVLLGGNACGEDLSRAADDAEGVSPTLLDEAIEEVMQQREYSWRLPRVLPVEEVERGIIGRFLTDALEKIRGWAQKMGKWIWGILEWVGEHLFPSIDRPAALPGVNWLASLHGLAYVLLALALCALAVLLLRVWRQRVNRASSVEAEPVVTAEDLEEEHLTADALPEDRWLEMAQELIQQGEFRLALRALFLGTLARLSRLELVTIRRFKSNRDYQRELERRAHAYPGTPETFDKNVLLFESAWYGEHEVTQWTIEEFRGNQERIRDGVEGTPTKTPTEADEAAKTDGNGSGEAHA